MIWHVGLPALVGPYRQRQPHPHHLHGAQLGADQQTGMARGASLFFGRVGCIATSTSDNRAGKCRPATCDSGRRYTFNGLAARVSGAPLQFCSSSPQHADPSLPVCGQRIWSAVNMMEPTVAPAKMAKSMYLLGEQRRRAISCAPNLRSRKTCSPVEVHPDEHAAGRVRAEVRLPLSERAHGV